MAKSKITQKASFAHEGGGPPQRWRLATPVTRILRYHYTPLNFLLLSMIFLYYLLTFAVICVIIDI